MHEIAPTTIETAVGGWGILTAAGSPTILDEYRERATLEERFTGDPDDDGSLFTAVARPGEDWPSLIVTQRWGPTGAGFRPGVLVVPDSGRVFIGAGMRILCYRDDAGVWRRQWQETAAYPGFWGWRLHGDVVVMSGEIEMAAWTVDGERLWVEAVEPPWSYEVIDGTVHLNVEGRVRAFPLAVARSETWRLSAPG
jgi:hypothetical protein